MFANSHLLVLASLALGTSIAAQGTGGGACTDKISFNSITPGTVVTQVFTDSGAGPINVSAMNPALAGNRALIFNSASPTGGDVDLGTPNVTFGGPGVGVAGQMGMTFENAFPLGNLMIVAEDLVDSDMDGLIDDPDDADLVGTQVNFDFASLVSPLSTVTVHSITVIDIEDDEAPPVVTLFGPGGVLLSTTSLSQPGDNGVSIDPLGDVSGVESMLIVFNSSGGFTDFCFTINQDCNGNGIPDIEDIASGTSQDCDADGVPDECQPDCDSDGTIDACEADCDMDGTPDDCEADCDMDGTPDDCEPDCDMDGTPDDCETEPDCNGNMIPDSCDIASGASQDIDGDGVPDECQACPPQPATETIVLGTPPNPNALLPGTTGGPVIGTNWQPIIDHTTFAPGAVMDFLGVSILSGNVVTPFGTQICNFPPMAMFTTTPGSAFNVRIPPMCADVGRTLCAQGLSFTPGPTFEFTNAIDFVLGTF